MSKSYVANSTINFEGYKFYVRPGDQLSYDAKHGNSLTVFRNGKFEKVIKVAPLVIEAFLKSKFLLEVKVPAAGTTLISAATAEQVAKDVTKNLGHLRLTGADTENHREQMADLRKQYDEQHPSSPNLAEKALKRRKAKGELVTITPELAETLGISPPQEAVES